MTAGRLPHFVIIGAMKCATSTLHSQLAAQPGFCMSEPKEPNFFSDDDQWARGLAWYEGLFSRCASGDLRGESSTHYTKRPDLPEALPRMANHLPNAKLIYVMRHPIDRLVSHYVHGWSERSISVPIDEAVDKHPELIDYGRYSMQVIPYLQAFGSASVLPLFMERMTADPQGELERVCKFLGYTDNPVWQDLHQNVSAERMRRSRVRDALVYNPLVTPIRRGLIPRSVRERIKSLWQLRETPVLGASVRTRLEAVFDKDLTQLGILLGVELNCKNFKEAVVEKPLDWAQLQTHRRSTTGCGKTGDPMSVGSAP